MKNVLTYLLACTVATVFASCSKPPEAGHDHGSHSSAPPKLPTGKTKSPADAKLYIISPKDGEEVSSPVVVKFGLKGMGVAPAGLYLSEEAPTGHHHLLIDVEKLPDLNLPLPKDDNHRHFGNGQTEASIELTPGKHTLQLVLGDHSHIPHDPPVKSEKITITVK